MKHLKRSAVHAVLLASVSAPVLAAEIKVGVFLGFTGAIESIVANMGPAAELAIKEVSDSGALLGGTTVKAVRGDTTCTDAAVASAAAERLITSEGVKAIVGGDCSGVTTAALQNVALPNGIVMVSPSATSPALSTIEDNGLFFRTAPSDARQGEIVSDILMDKGVKTIALTYTNNDYGKGLADSIERNFKKAGGKVTIVAAHEDGKGDYSAEVGALASAGGDVLVVAGYLDQGGRGIIQGALDTGSFDTFYLPDGMVGEALPAAIGKDLNGSYGANPGTDSPGAKTFATMAEKAGFKAGPFSAESYDAAALILLAMQAAKSTESAKIKDTLMSVANAPGEKIFPGELAKGLKILSDGGEIDYVGASAVELVGAGESAGNYREIVIENQAVKAVRYR
ncbi:MAG: ABC transporter substrate-binding protein [Gammaproteobacteria bacterium]|nr:ABC transporter substrate-binding protein [Gammaproteobacteria bacterium]